MGNHFIARLTRDGGPPPAEELDSLMARAERSPDRAAWLGTRKPGAGWSPAPGGSSSIALAMDVQPATGAVDAVVGRILERRDERPDDLGSDARSLYDPHPGIATWWRLGDPSRACLRSLEDIPGRSDGGGLPAARVFQGRQSFVYWRFDALDLLTELLRSREAHTLDEAGEFVDSRWYPLPTFLADDGYGDLRLKGHRVTLYHVARLALQRMGRDALLEHYPTIPPALMDQVLRFCAEHPEEMSRYVARYAEAIDRQIVSAPRKGPSLEELRRRDRERSEAKA